MTRISVVIPVFNRASELQKALISVTTQSYPAEEILVVDDGSDVAVETEFSSQFPGVRFIRQRNLGVSAARNNGIKKAGGDWIAFLDSDDEWLPHKLEAQVQALKNSPESRVCHSDEIWIRNGVRVNPMKKHKKSGGDIFLQCLPLCAMSPSSVLIHKDIFAEVGVFDETLPACEDYDLWLRICSRYNVLY
ncbi:MAG: glycosyltransferase family 2 protein, partial [Gammaproteobacteria bacterium]|nr:glycosyltransferase family 2 protein [Gammaproteobacteria bacterium]